MSTLNPPDDHRGVDRAELRELQRLTPEQRVDRLVETVTTWSQILAYTQADRLR